MPLAPYANGPLSAVGPAAELKLDDLVLEDRKDAVFLGPPFFCTG